MGDIKLYSKFQLWFWINIENLIINLYELIINIIIVGTRTDNSQWLFYQGTWFFVIQIIYKNPINNQIMTNISNYVQQLYQSIIFTDTINNVKWSTIFTRFKFRMYPLLTFVLFFICHNSSHKYNYIWIPFWLTH